MFSIAIVGRPNVGKSTLFNRICGRKAALVSSMPGMTRDRKEAEAEICGRRCRIVDTAGLEEAPEQSLQGRMMKQTDVALQNCDLAVLVVDGKSGATPADRYFVDKIRKLRKPAILAVNKSDADRKGQGYFDALSLGMEPTVSVSAEHGLGLDQLYPAIDAALSALEAAGQQEQESDVSSAQEKAELLRVSIVGRPNAGKSTLTNALLGEERCLTGPEAGITRDTVSVRFDYKGKAVELADTAGMRKKASVHEEAESLAVGDGLRSVRFAHVVILLVDIDAPLERQDLALASLAEREGRCLVIAVNKCDKHSNLRPHLEEIRHVITKKIPSVSNLPCIPVSALRGEGLDALMKACFDVYKKWNMRVPTHKLNTWLKEAERRNPPPLGKRKRPIRLKYIAQGNVRPPTFTLFVNYPAETPDHYRRFLLNDMGETFGVGGVPVRLMLRKSGNPYEKNSSGRS
ncbi:MAG: ribosome biogenesis GTPase Der [Rickettsiales bacterium]